MPDYTIETSYRLPAYRHRTYHAETVVLACRQATEDDDWSAEKLSYEDAGETYVSGIWNGVDAAYSGPAIPVPSHFSETAERKVKHFERWRRLNLSQFAARICVRVSGSGRPSDFVPGRDRVGSKLAVIGGGQMFAMEVEKICDLAVG